MLAHTAERYFKCQQCDMTYKNNGSLAHHIRRVHYRERTHLCHYCSKSFYSKVHLEVHLRIHTKEKPYVCTECGKRFSTVTILRHHSVTHSDTKDFKCTLCDMAFNRLCALQKHVVIHTKERRFPCKYCGKKFARSDHRKRHENKVHEKLVTDPSQSKYDYLANGPLRHFYTRKTTSDR